MLHEIMQLIMQLLNSLRPPAYVMPPQTPAYVMPPQIPPTLAQSTLSPEMVQQMIHSAFSAL